MAQQREWFEKDYYAILGVASTATPKEITTAYRKLARQLHPDANPGDAAAESQFKEVSAAYDVIGDPARRAEYDKVRQMVSSGGMGFGSPGRQGPRFDPRGATGFGAENFGDIIGNLFGQGAGGWSAGGPFSQGPQRGQDLETSLHLSFLDAQRGVTTSVNLLSEASCPECSGSGAARGTSPRVCSQCSGRGVLDDNQGVFSLSRPCEQCNGRGSFIDTPCGTCAGSGRTTRPRVVKVRLPEGVRDGQQIRLKGKGGAGTNGGPAGDLYVRVQVGEHPIFGRDGDNLTVRVPITVAEACLGADVKVPTLDGDSVTIRVPAGSPHGKTLRVKGRGSSTPNGKGDLLVQLEIAIPTRLTDEERAALEAFAAAQTQSPRDSMHT